jgi:hypothetical protein
LHALTALLHEGCDASDIIDAVRLVNQLIKTFPAELATHFRDLLPALVQRCAACWHSHTVLLQY